MDTMKKVLSWILFATPLFYVLLMKATGQPIETAVILMLVPFIAAPFVLGRFLPNDEEEAKAEAMRVLRTVATGGRPAAPSRAPRSQARPRNRR
jgi:hypothetical protein